MAPRDTVRALAVTRIALGAGLLLAPRRGGAAWVGGDGATPGASALARAVGIRDVVFGGMLLHTLDHPQVAQRWTATCGLVDAVDGTAVLAVRDQLPGGRGLLGSLVGFGSAVVHLALSRQLTSPSGLEGAAARSTPAPASSPDTVMPDGAEEAKRAMGARTIGVDTPK
jgi:hypothetical protein